MDKNNILKEFYSSSSYNKKNEFIINALIIFIPFMLMYKVTNYWFFFIIYLFAAWVNFDFIFNEKNLIKISFIGNGIVNAIYLFKFKEVQININIEDVHIYEITRGGDGGRINKGIEVKMGKIKIFLGHDKGWRKSQYLLLQYYSNIEK